MAADRQVTIHAEHSQLEALHDEWSALFTSSRSTNPFLHPVWVTTWLRHFVAPGELRAVTIRSGARLTAVAPFYLSRARVLPGVHIRRLELPGVGEHAELAELPEMLTSPDGARALLREAIVASAAESEAAWVKLALGPDQGWLAPDWLTTERAPSAGMPTVIHNWTRPAVILNLPSSGEELTSALKRNVKESLRRGRNRLHRDGHEWHVERHDSPGSELDAALAETMRLHSARAQASGRASHSDYLADSSDARFLAEVVPALAAMDSARVYLLRVAGKAAAGALVLRAGDSMFFSLSGLDPAWWDYSLPALLQAECLRDGMAEGVRTANMSIGPTVAKTRWSDALAHWNEFVIVPPRRTARLAHAAYAHRRLDGLLRGSPEPVS